ncbi:hypothetical protein PLICRDRAFT_53762 [Plicaturopsis crispa FD-325 SS-3]|nr:hypothetical protein PLICRDRAFT_53762 [Plicaturopsis crispa FD-325 SS-3]
MAGKKRASEDSAASTRATKAAKTDDASSPNKAAKGRKGPKANLSSNDFKTRALPLHLNITHTPPSMTDKDTVSVESADPGLIGSATLLPSSFSTGSYGWKGSKRIQIELDNPEGGEKEKVHVMLTINATVMGSKDAPAGEEDKEEDKAEAEKADDAGDEE